MHFRYRTKCTWKPSLLSSVCSVSSHLTRRPIVSATGNTCFGRTRPTVASAIFLSLFFDADKVLYTYWPLCYASSRFNYSRGRNGFTLIYARRVHFAIHRSREDAEEGEGAVYMDYYIMQWSSFPVQYCPNIIRYRDSCTPFKSRI